MATTSLKLRRASARARSEGSAQSFRSIDRLSRSRKVVDRLFALSVIRDRIARLGPQPEYLPVGRRMIADLDNDCRWQALIVVGEFIKSEPEAIWRVVRRYGSSIDQDMRTGVATVLLEHLFEHYPRYRSEAARLILKGNERLRDTFNMCWNFGARR
jgi:hypothetical protein